MLGVALSPRANSLNAIRLVLATMVIVSHSWPIGQYGTTPVHGGFAPGGWAVDGFFALSGYLITGSRLGISFPSYLKRRVLRIYPGFVMCLLVVVTLFAPLAYLHLHHTLSGYFTKPSTPLHYLLVNLGLKVRARSVAGTPVHGQAWAGTLWTLYFEFLCYLLVGVLACARAYRQRPHFAVTLFVVATAISLRNNHVVHTSDWTNFVRLVPFFLAGSAVYMLRDRIPCVWPLAVLSAALLVVLPWGGPRFVVLTAVPFTYLLLYLGAVVPVGLGRTNDISYGVYMYGYPVEESVRYLHLSSQPLFILLSIAATVPFAAASWLFVERPAMRWRRVTPQNRRGDRERRREAAETVASLT